MSAARRDGRDGYILVTVLALAVVLTGLVAAGSVVVRSALGAARVANDGLATSGLLSSGLEIAAYQLSVKKIAPDLVDGRRIRLTGGTVTPHVTDEGGKVDLNAADPKLFAGVLAGVGMDEATARTVVATIVDWRGPTNGIIPEDGPGGAAGAKPAPANPATANAPPKRRGLQSVEVLRDIDGVRPSDMRLLRQRLTVYNPDGRIDVMTASPEVLGSLPGMTELKMTQLMAARDAGSPTEALAAVGGDLASFVKAKPGPAYTVRIDAADAAGHKKSGEAVIAASKSPNQPYYILDWRN